MQIDLKKLMKTPKGVGSNGGIQTLRKISVVPMITATYFMVAGGPYGLEDIVKKPAMPPRC